METQYYPWPGDYTPCTHQSPVAVVLLSTHYIPPKGVAIYGPVKTENIGLEKIIANVISNPHIRFLMLCGTDIRGHYPGSSLLALHTHGLDKNHKIIGAPGAIPYIENLSLEAIERFRTQVSIIDARTITDTVSLDKRIKALIDTSPPPFGDPFIAIRMKKIREITKSDKRAIHSKIVVDWRGKVTKRG